MRNYRVETNTGRISFKLFEERLVVISLKTIPNDLTILI
jgi:hypothetical protein